MVFDNKNNTRINGCDQYHQPVTWIATTIISSRRCFPSAGCAAVKAFDLPPQFGHAINNLVHFALRLSPSSPFPSPGLPRSAPSSPFCLTRRFFLSFSDSSSDVCSHQEQVPNLLPATLDLNRPFTSSCTTPAKSLSSRSSLPSTGCLCMGCR